MHSELHQVLTLRLISQSDTISHCDKIQKRKEQKEEETEKLSEKARATLESYCKIDKEFDSRLVLNLRFN